jgi:hypothetical protein
MEEDNFNRKQKVAITKERQKYKSGEISWQNYLVQQLGGYSNPVLVNGQEIIELASDEKAFVCMDFVKSGEHVWSVQTTDEFYISKALVRRRDERIPFFNKFYSQSDGPFMFDKVRDESMSTITLAHIDGKFWRMSEYIFSP